MPINLLPDNPYKVLKLWAFGMYLKINEIIHEINNTISGVSSFNTRTGAVTLQSTDVTDALTFTPENITNKSTNTLLGNSDTLYPTQNAVKTFVLDNIVGLWDDRGNYDASGNTYPNAGGSGAGGAIEKGNIWTVSISGTLGGAIVEVGDTVRALIAAPAQTPANWAIGQNNIGYTAENTANKSTSTGLGISDVFYPTQNAVKTYVDTGLSTKQNTIGYTAENQANKSDNTALGVSTTLYPTQNAVKTYVDNAIVGGGFGAWSAKSALIIGAVTTNPTKATSPENDFIQYRVNGNEVQVKFLYSQISAVGGVAGSGDYLFTLPNGYAFDTAIHPIYTDTAVNKIVPFSMFGQSAGMAQSLNSYVSALAVIPYSSTQFRIYLTGPNYPKDFISNTRFELNNANIAYTGWFTFYKL